MKIEKIVIYLVAAFILYRLFTTYKAIAVKTPGNSSPLAASNASFFSTFDPLGGANEN